MSGIFTNKVGRSYIVDSVEVPCSSGVSPDCDRTIMRSHTQKHFICFPCKLARTNARTKARWKERQKAIQSGLISGIAFSKEIGKY